MKFQYIVGYHNFWPFLFKQANDSSIDENISMQLPRGSFSVNNKIIHCTHFVDTLRKFNEMFGTRFVPEESTFGGQTYFNIAILEEGKTRAVQEQKEETVSKTEEEKVEDIPVSEPVADIETIVVEDSGDATPDWEWIESLDNNKEDKLALDQYAESKFSVKLSRTMKISNMIKAFKEELESK